MSGSKGTNPSSLDESKRASGYFEAILQLRPEDKDVLLFVENQMKGTKYWIAKIIKLKTGVDLYMSSWRFTTALGKKLKKRFKGGKLVVSRSLYGVHKQTCKKVYRVTVLFRYKKEDL